MDFLESRVVTGCLLVAALIAFFSLRGLDLWSPAGPGPALIPTGAIAIIALCSAWAIFRPEPAEAAEDGVEGRRSFAAYAGVLVMLAVAVPFLGIILPLAAGTAITMRWGEKRSWTISLAFAIALTAAMVIVFNILLRVPPADGLIEAYLKRLGVF